MAKISKKERNAQLVETMKRWQKVENGAVASTAQVIEQTDNALIRLVMEVIQRDSNNHHRIQQLIIDSMTTTPLTMPVGELEKVWSGIEKHLEIEKRTIDLAEEALATLDHDKDGLQKYLLNYLLEDEKKHDKMLEDLVLIKRAMYP